MFLLLTKEIKAGGPIAVGGMASQGPAYWHGEITTPWSPADLPAGTYGMWAQARADALLQGAKRVQPIQSG